MLHKISTSNLRQKPQFINRLRLYLMGNGVLVWSPGKVGTLLIVSILKEHGINVIHAHGLSEVAKGKYFVKSNHVKYNYSILGKITLSIRRAKFKLWKNFGGKPKIITGIRNLFTVDLCIY